MTKETIEKILNNYAKDGQNLIISTDLPFGNDGGCAAHFIGTRNNPNGSSESKYVVDVQDEYIAIRIERTERKYNNYTGNTQEVKTECDLFLDIDHVVSIKVINR